MSTETLTWAGIFLCFCRSAMFSGLNLAVFSLNRLQLEVEAAGGSHAARKVLDIRSHSNYVLTTILWSNVGIIVLLALLSNSVMAVVSAFLFSTFFITIFGEILPQAYFSRNALRMASLLAPLLRFYQVLLYPVVKPSSLVLDADGFLRHALLHRERTSPHEFCYPPVVIKEKGHPLGEVLAKLSFDVQPVGDHVISEDIVLLWTDSPRIITGPDLFGRLLRGIARRVS